MLVFECSLLNYRLAPLQRLRTLKILFLSNHKGKRMYTEYNKILISKIIEGHCMLRDYARKREITWWKYFKLTCFKVIILLILKNTIPYESFLWTIIFAGFVFFGFFSLVTVALFQRDKKYHEEWRQYYERKASEGITCSVVVEGKEVLL